MRFLAKRDAIHTPCVQKLVEAGRSVAETHQLGGGFPDVVVGWSRTVMRWMEFKDPKTGRLTPAQERFFADWRGPEILIAHSVEEALALTGVRVAGSPHETARRGAAVGGGGEANRDGSVSPGNGSARSCGKATCCCPACGQPLERGW